MTDQNQAACAAMTTEEANATIHRVAREHLQELREVIIPGLMECDPQLALRSQREAKQLEMALEAIDKAPLPRVLIDMSGGLVNSVETSQAISVSVVDTEADDAPDWFLTNGGKAWIDNTETKGQTSGYEGLERLLKDAKPTGARDGDDESPAAD